MEKLLAHLLLIFFYQRKFWEKVSIKTEIHYKLFQQMMSRGVVGVLIKI